MKNALSSELEKALVGNNIYTIMKHIPVGIMFLECPNGKIVYANDQAIRLFGANLLGLEFKDQATKLATLYQINGEPYLIEMLPMSRAMRGEVVVNEELVIERHVDGSRIIVSVNAVALENEKGEIVGSVGVFEDVTERKQLQAKLAQYAEGLEVQVEEKTRQLKDSERMVAIGQVAGMVGHDVRNPLQAIVNELFFVKQEIVSLVEGKVRQDRLLESLGVIQEQIDYIGKIISDLQDFAKPLRPNLVEVELCQLIPEALKTVSIPSNVQAGAVCEEGLLPLKLDVTFMRRILTNLVNNAIQAMPDGGRLTVKASKKDSSVVIVVEDTGVGVADEVKSKLFTPMFTTKVKGQGFGLPVVKRLVEAQGGTVSFESQIGKGTKFIICFPQSKS